MDYLTCLFILLSVFCLIKVVSSLTIQFDANSVGVLGSDNTTLSCAFTKEDNEEITQIILKSNNESANQFIDIAFFRPDRQLSVLTPGGNYLSGRVVLSNITSSSTVAALTFSPLQCNDQRVYQCVITYVFDVTSPMERTETTNLTVLANPSGPDISSEVSQLTEGNNITFTCFGNIGKPPSTFFWQRRHGDITVDSYNNVTTTFTMVQDKCSYYGTSNLTIQVTERDNNATFRCLIHNLKGEDYYKDTQRLDVKYQVRKPNITRQPMEVEYLEGSEKITLTCSGRGNPQPTYTWYKDGNMNETLNTTSTLYITEVITNNSGIYRCNASNNVSGIKYTETTTVNISIVKERTTTTTTKATTTKHKDSSTEKNKDDNDIATVGGIVGGIVAVVTVAVIIVCIVKRRKRSGSKSTVETRQQTVRTIDGYDSVSLEKGNGVQYKQGESQSHQNLGYDPSAVDKKGYQNLGYDPNTETKGPEQDTRYEYASVDEASKLKNRKNGEQSNANQEKSNQADVEDPYGESKDDTYDRLGQKYPHKTDENKEQYDTAGALSEQL